MSTSSVRAITRIAWRGIGRSRGRAALIVLLVLLPVAAMAAAITLITTVTPTAEASARHQMGMADYLVYPSGTATTDTLRTALPDGAQVEPWSFGVSNLVLPGRIVPVPVRSMDLDGLAEGKLVITAGRQPHNQQEVAVSQSVAAIADVGIGGRIELDDAGASTVVGLIEDEFDLRGLLVLQDASVARELADGERVGGQPAWLVGLPVGGPENVEWLDDETDCPAGGCGFFGRSRAAGAAPFDDGTNAAVIVLGGLALVEATLVAAAAFSVGVRRRQRELGLLAAAGAERRHLAGTVLSEGVLLGGTAALLGVAIGFLGVIGLSPWLDELTNRRNQPVVMNATYLFLAGGIGLLACLLAALMPARAASRLPVLMALSGRRPPLSPARRLLIAGVVLVALGLILTSSGAATVVTSPQERTLSMLLLLLGAICGVLGFGACSPWLVERLERLGFRLRPAPRIALRDTARARSRNGPIVTAILAAFAATVAVAAYASSVEAEAAARWRPWLRADQLIVQGEGADRAGADAASNLGAMASAPIRSLVASDRRDLYASVPAPDPDEAPIAEHFTVGDAELLTALGAEAGLSTLDNGGVVLVLPDVQRPIFEDGDFVGVATEPPQQMTHATVIVQDGGIGDDVSTFTLPATVIATGLASAGLADAVVSPATAERLGLVAGPTQMYLIRLPRAVGEADVARAAEFAAQQPNTRAEASLGPARPGDVVRTLLTVVSLLFALSVTGIAVALGEAESRPDQRTLLAVGADPGIRRRIAAARAGVLGLMAGLLAVPAGLLPAWGLLGSRGAPLVVPIPEVIAAVVILPLAGIVGALLLTRRIPAWSALREAGS